jgi:stage II sporulation protein D
MQWVKLRGIFFGCLSLSLFSSNLEASASESTNEILLRVLVATVKPDQSLTLSGSNIFMGSADHKTSDSIKCEFHSGLSVGSLWSNPMLELHKWHCKSERQMAKVDSSLFIHSHRRLLSFNGQTYRGHLELVLNKNSLQVINHVPLDAYLASLANSEMSSSFPEEAIKAQIIAARSYALSMALERRKKHWSFDLYNTQYDQVYRGVQYESAKSWKLAKETSRQVLRFDRGVLKAFYHSSSGGHLELPTNVWSRNKAAGTEAAYRAKPNPYDENLKGGSWSINLSRELGEQVRATGPFLEIKVLERTEGKRVRRLQITGKRGKTQFSGVQFRNLFGPGWIKSALFDVKKQGSSFVIEGKGWGHGVGMSQWGAKVMADRGKSAEQILKFYYPEASVAIYGKPTSISSSGPTTTASAR